MSEKLRTWWVFYWTHERYESKGIIEGEEYEWTCNAETRKGDLALLYVRRPTSALVGLFLATSNAQRAMWAKKFTVHDFACDVEVMRLFKTPLTLHEMRRDTSLFKAWGAVRGGFQAPGGRPPEITDVIVRHLAKKIPELKKFQPRGGK